jgi:1,4-alpha-glucan branching enzyme
MSELMQILNSRHSDPHRVLGMHEIDVDGKKSFSVRVFNPQASAIWVLDPADNSFIAEMERTHDDGFFEVVIDRTEWFRYKLRVEFAANGDIWETYDPYSFMPVISDWDLQFFGEGNHYQIYEKLGSHPMNVDGIDGVLFGVWAPNAKRISVIGDFNSWDGRRHQMRSLGSSGIWEIFIPGLSENDKYKYEIVTYDNSLIQKFDPYGNFFELRPSPCALITDLNKYEWQDSAWMEERKSKDIYNAPLNIYEVHVGSWRRFNGNGRYLSYVELADQLIPYVKEMGYTHVELLPVMEHPFDGSWGYQVTGYFAPTSRYGNPQEFMYFVDKCHQNGIGVILDWVPAHFATDSFALGKYDGTSLYEHEDPRKGAHPEWGTLIFNYGRLEVKNFLIANAMFWINKYHADGLRVDGVASMLYLDYGKSAGQWVPNCYGGKENLEAVEFMKHLNSIIEKTCPGVLTIAEESTSWAGVSRPPEKGGLGYSMKWNMGWMHDFLTYISKETVYRRYHHNSLTFGMVYAFTENFVLVLSHDEVVHGKRSLIGKMPGDIWQQCANMRLAYGFMFGHPGKKLVFMGGEFGQFAEWDEKKQLDWFLLDYPHHRQIQEFVRDISHLYKEERAFWYSDFGSDGFEWINCNDADRSQVSFVRKTDNPDETLLFACNFTPVPLTEHRIGVPFEADYEEILNSDDLKYGGGGIINTGVRHADRREFDGREFSIPLALPPLGVSIFKVKK